MNTFWGKNIITGGARRSRPVRLVHIFSSLGYEEKHWWDHFIHTDGGHGLGHGSQGSWMPLPLGRYLDNTAANSLTQNKEAECLGSTWPEGFLQRNLLLCPRGYPGPPRQGNREKLGLACALSSLPSWSSKPIWPLTSLSPFLYNPRGSELGPQSLIHPSPSLVLPL